MSDLTAQFAPGLGTPSVQPIERDRWMVTPPPIEIRDHRSDGGHWELLVRPTGMLMTAIRFQEIEPFGDKPQPLLRLAPVETAWVGRNSIVRIANGDSNGEGRTALITVTMLVHAPSGEPPVDFALDLMAFPELPYEMSDEGTGE